MQIPLNQFEQYIDETILQRGLSYFRNGYVSEPEEITPCVYEAMVKGSEDYTVQLTIKNGNVIEHVCNCPYDMGPVCKHVAAVIFYLQRETLEIEEKKSVKGKTKEGNTVKPAKKKTVAQETAELLDKIPHEELKQFILEKSASNPAFRNIFLSSFAHLGKSETKEFYAKQLKSILRTAADRNGFISWNETRQFGKAVSDLLATAQKHIENKNYQSAVFICFAVMEEMTEALQYADDSNGDVGGNIDLAFEILENLADEKLPAEIRKSIFEYALSAFDKRIYSGWDWHSGMLVLASLFFTNDDEAQRILVQIDKANLSEYDREHAQAIKLGILKKTKGEKEAEKFIQENLSNPILRREAMSKAMNNKQHEKAIQIAEDGIKHDTKDKPGLAKEWYDWLLKIAQAQHDRKKIVEYSRFLFIDNFRHDQDYYQLMKKNVAPENWNAFVEDIVREIASKKRWLEFGLIAGIYIKEQWWDRLMQLVAENPSLQNIEEYEKYLAKDYAVKLAGLYEQGITAYMKNSTGRNHYQTACRYLRRMIKLGAGDKVKMIIADFRKQYPQRRALMEELNRV